MQTKFDNHEGKYQLAEVPDPSEKYTYADYLQWKFTERLELINGRIFRTSAPNTLVQKTYARIIIQLYTALSNTKFKVFHAPFDVRLPVINNSKDNEITTVVQPDICAVSNGSIIDGRGCCGVPDFVIEILSPGSTSHDIQAKFDLYQGAGIPEYWLINPAEKDVIVYNTISDGQFTEGRQYNGKDIIRSIILNGFTIAVADIFK